MSTFAELKTYVARRLLDPNNTAISSADVGSSINDAIRYWKYREFWFNTSVNTGTLTLQDGTITLPNDFLVPATNSGAFHIEYSSQRYPLCKVDSEGYNNMWRGNGYGLPKYYALVGGSYEVYPLPDRAYTILTSYLKDYTDLSSDGDTNDFTIYAPRLISLWALANLIAELRQDEKMETYFRQACMDEYRQLTVMTDKSEASGSLTIY